MAENEPIAATEQDEPARTECRALVVLSPAGRDRSEERPLAGFIAQLIACHRRLPAFRRAGRAEPAAARASYARTGAPSPRRFDLVV